MLICIPSVDEQGIASQVSPHLGRAAVFTVIDDNTQEVRIVSNNGKHHGGDATPAEIIAQAGVNVVLCSGLGARAVHMFEQHNIMVYCNAAGTVGDALEAYQAGRLSKATETTACQHHHDH